MSFEALCLDSFKQIDAKNTGYIKNKKLMELE